MKMREEEFAIATEINLGSPEGVSGTLIFPS